MLLNNVLVIVAAFCNYYYCYCSCYCIAVAINAFTIVVDTVAVAVDAAAVGSATTDDGEYFDLKTLPETFCCSFIYFK